MEFLSVNVQDWFYVLASIYIVIMLVVMLVMVVMALKIKRKISRKIDEVKAIPLKSKAFTTTFLKALFR